MPSDTAEFFERIGRMGPDSLPRKLRGTIRFDLTRGAQTDHWYVAMTDGGVFVSHENLEANCVAYTNEALFDRLVGGEAHLIAALLRNEITADGCVSLLILFRRLLPDAVESRDSRDWVRAGGGRDE